MVTKETMLPPDHYEVPVINKIPPLEDLTKLLRGVIHHSHGPQFFENWERSDFRPKDSETKLPKKRVFLLRSFEEELLVDDTSVWAWAHGYLPTTREELVSFGAIPELRELWKNRGVIAGGSILEGRFVPVLSQDSPYVLGRCLLQMSCNKHIQVLFVRYRQL